MERGFVIVYPLYPLQEIGWFDRVENSPGILTARLATEVSALETATGTQLGTLMEASSLVIASLVIGFTYSWILSLVNLCFVPLLIVFSGLQVWLNFKFH